MLGRINRIKGQEVLLAALARMPAAASAGALRGAHGRRRLRGSGRRGAPGGDQIAAAGLAAEPRDVAAVRRRSGSACIAWADVGRRAVAPAGIARSRRHRGDELTAVRSSLRRSADCRRWWSDGVTGWLVPPERRRRAGVGAASDCSMPDLPWGTIGGRRSRTLCRDLCCGIGRRGNGRLIIARQAGSAAVRLRRAVAAASTRRAEPSISSNRRRSDCRCAAGPASPRPCATLCISCR